MDKKNTGGSKLATKSSLSSKTQAHSGALGKGVPIPPGLPWVREDGAVCFGDECVVIKPQADGKLLLEVKPTRCGDETGKVILAHLLKTAGKGVLISIPSELEEVPS